MLATAPRGRRDAPREPQHRDRPAADDPRGAGRHRGARARDGDARRRADRRARGDRRAGRRRDRQRRPGRTSSCSGTIEAIAAREGRADRRAAPRRRPASCPPASRCSTPHLRADVRDGHLRARAATSSGRCRRAGARARRSRRAHMRRNALAALAAARAARASSRRAASRSRSRALRGRADRARRTGSSSSTTATTPTRCRCAPPSTTSPRPRAGRRVAVLGDMLELGPDERALPPRDRRPGARAPASTLLVDRRRARAAMRPRRSAARRHAVADARGRGALVPGCSSRATRCSSRPRAASGSKPCAQALAPARPRSGRGPDRRARPRCCICIFLRPQFIEFLREREFGQHIREEGPEGHHAKAGTPTMGGIIIFIADRGPVPDPHATTTGARSASSATALACALLGFADDYTKIVKRRSLGLRARTKLVVHDR